MFNSGADSSTRETPGSTEVMWEYKWENTDAAEVRISVVFLSQSELLFGNQTLEKAAFNKHPPTEQPRSQ